MKGVHQDRRGNALVVSYHAPEPDRDSGARRLFHFIEFLQQDGWSVRFLATDGAGDEVAVRRLQRMGVMVFDSYRDAPELILRDSAPDVALIAYWKNAVRLMPSIRSLSPATRVLVDSVDLHFVRESRRAFSTRSEPWLGMTEGQSRSIGQELNVYAAADGVLTVSSLEADLLTSLLWDDRRAFVVPDYEAVERSTLEFGARRGMLLVGSFQHPPNAESVRYLLGDILPHLDPALLAEHPLSVVGNKLGDDLRVLARPWPDVKMVGWVPEVEPYLASARVNLVPLLHGAGTKRKLVMALAMGTPTVSTTIGIEGIDAVDGEHVLVADEAAGFAAAIERLLTDAALWRRIRDVGASHVARRHHRDAARDGLATAVRSVMDAPPRHIVPVGVVGAVGEGHTGSSLSAASMSSLEEALGGSSETIVLVRHAVDAPELTGHQLLPVEVLGADSGPRHPSRRPLTATVETARRAGASDVLVALDCMSILERDSALLEYLAEEADAVYRDEAFVLLRFRQPLELDTDTALSPADVEPVVTLPAGDGPHVKDPSGGDAQLIAFYLPQFHPIPQNDAWWGPGFTEWRNVARARPLFDGHLQPHVPGELGFYDLRLAETREQQAELARHHGVHGFCYYHYWFHGKRLLERPFNDVLSSGRPDLPFCLCWVNESWSRRWDGREDDLLIRQRYSAEDDRRHIRALLPALTDDRYITVDGRPVLLVWRVLELPDALRTTDTWREEVVRAGLPGLHLVAVETAWDLGRDASSLGFDAKVLFQPQFGWLITDAGPGGAHIEVLDLPDLQVYDYDAVREALRDLEPVSYRRYETVFPAWDNTPRKGSNGVVLHGSTPQSYELWLQEAVARAHALPSSDRFVFLNAWNEWAEGCHLEPDRLHGRAYLEATRRVMLASSADAGRSPSTVGR
jgi:glycosyltransferase involved in cell wall biosynthesis